jgi:hypothetical protein
MQMAMSEESKALRARVCSVESLVRPTRTDALVVSLPKP